MSLFAGKVAIVGVAESDQIGKVPDKPAILLHAEADHQGSLRFEHVSIDGRGVTRVGFLGAEPTLDGRPAVICNATITGVTDADYSLDYSGDSIAVRFVVQSGC